MAVNFKTYIKNSWMCIKYPFLYPRNRWDDKYHANVLSNKLYELNKQSSMLVVVSISLERNTDDSNQKYHLYGKYDKNNFEAYLTNSSKDSGYDTLNMCNKNGIIKHNLNEQIGRPDKFEVLGISVDEHLKSPYIKVHVKLKDETDTTNYGFPYYNTRLITDAKIHKKYKFWNWVDKNILDNIFIFPKYTEWDALKKYYGWYKTFGKDLLKELRKQLVKDKLLYKFRIRDIKEKWGVLEIYTNYRTEGVYQILDKYRSLSRKTCIYCGKPATYCTKGWIRYICEDCLNKLERKPNVKPIISKFDENDYE